QRAQAGGLGGANYKAWLASSTINAASRITGSGGWIRVDGRPLASSAAALTGGSGLHPPRVNELGADAGSTHALTKAHGDGTVLFTGTTTCGDYTNNTGPSVMTGRADGGKISWTYNVNGGSCNFAYPIYCFELDSMATPTVPAPPNNAKYMFAATT